MFLTKNKVIALTLSVLIAGGYFYNANQSDSFVDEKTLNTPLEQPQSEEESVNSFKNKANHEFKDVSTSSKLETIEQVKEKTDDEHAILDNYEEGESIPAVSDVLSITDGEASFSTKKLEKLKFYEIEQFIDTIDFSNKTGEAVRKESTIHEILTGSETLLGETQFDRAVCNNELCAIVVSSYSIKNIDNTMDMLISDDELKKNFSGGLLRTFNSEGSFRGVLVGVNSDASKNIKVR